MRQLNIEERLERMEENIVLIRQMLEKLNPPQPTKSVDVSTREIMSVKQVAQFIGMDANTIYAKCSKGSIPFFKIGKQYRFNKQKINRWLQSQKQAPEIVINDFVDQYMQRNTRKS